MYDVIKAGYNLFVFNIKNVSSLFHCNFGLFVKFKPLLSCKLFETSETVANSNFRVATL